MKREAQGFFGSEARFFGGLLAVHVREQKKEKDRG